MPQSRGHILKNAVGPERLSASLRGERYCFETFMQEPLCYKKQNVAPGTITAPGGTSLDEVIVRTGRYQFEYVFLGDHTDLLVPVLASEGGYNFAFQTTTLDRGVELYFGGLKDAHPRNWVPSSEDWFARILLITSNASGVDLFFGARRVAAYAATLTEYSDVAGIRILGNSASTDGAYSIVTNLNNAGATDYTGTAVSLAGLEDATAVELGIRTIGRRAKFFINGAERFEVPAFDFDSGDVVSPVLRIVQTTDLAAQVKVLAFEGGPIADRQEDNLISLAGATA